MPINPLLGIVSATHFMVWLRTVCWLYHLRFRNAGPFFACSSFEENWVIFWVTVEYFAQKNLFQDVEPVTMWYPQMRSHVVRPETQLNPPFSVSGVPLEILDDVAVEPAPQRVLATFKWHWIKMKHTPDHPGFLWVNFFPMREKSTIWLPKWPSRIASSHRSVPHGSCQV